MFEKMNFSIENGYFIDVKGQKFKTIQTELIDDLSCLSKQLASEQEYLETQFNEKINEEVLYLMRDFQSFIAKNLIQSKINKGIILDVGCGSYIKVPPYLRDLVSNNRYIYIGLDPLKITQLTRDYLFINGKFENLHKYINQKFDILVFSTSLDHFEDLKAVENEIKLVTHKDSIVFFWVGLHDPCIVWEHSMTAFIRRNSWE